MVPREVYTLGAVQFNTQPLARLQGELLAKKAAKEEALDKYFNDLKGKITSAGMRSIDVKPFNEKLKNWISQGITNKSEIAKGGVAYQNHLEGYNSLVSDVELSKQEQKKDDEIAKLRFEDKIDEDLDFPVIQKRSKSIYDPEFYKNYQTRQPYSIGDFSANIPTWDVSKRKQFVDFALSGVKPAGKSEETETYDPKAMATTKVFDKFFTPQQMVDASKKAVAILSDESGFKTYKNILKEGEQKIPSDQFIQYATAYSKAFPNDIMNTPLKVAQAEIISSMAGLKETESKTIPNMAARISAAKTNKTEDEGFIDYWAQIKSRPEKSIGEKGMELGRIKGVLVESLTAIPKQRIIDIANKIKGRTFSDEELIIQTLPNGVTRIAEVVRDKFGVPRGVEEVTKIQSEDINIEPQIDVKAKREAVEGAKKSKRTYKIGGKEFTRQQIEQGAKSYGMTFEEYLAAFENE